MLDLAVVILTRNEEIHIARALNSVSGVAREVFVIDSHSTDDTPQIAAAAGAIVMTNTFVNYAKQYEWALQNAPISAAWVMRLDADELLTVELQDELQRLLPRLPPDVTGVNLNRRHIFLGRWIRHGGRYPLRLLRIWRRGMARIESRWMDEHMTLLSGRAITCAHDFVDHNLNDLGYFTDKHNKYATREAIDVLKERHRLGRPTEDLKSEKSSLQAAIKRTLKVRLYNRLPLWAGPTLYFSYRYIVQLGFLDGREGLIYNVLQGFWYRFLVAAKIVEFERALESVDERGDKIATLSRLTGYAIEDLRS